MNRLAGKVAIVLGTSRGIGRAIAERLSKDGATAGRSKNLTLFMGQYLWITVATCIYKCRSQQLSEEKLNYAKICKQAKTLANDEPILLG